MKSTRMREFSLDFLFNNNIVYVDFFNLIFIHSHCTPCVTFRMAPEMMTVKNNPNVSYWSLEKGYQALCNQIGYPKRIFNVKHSVSLTIFLQLFGQDIEYRCRGLIPGVSNFSTAYDAKIRVKNY